MAKQKLTADLVAALQRVGRDSAALAVAASKSPAPDLKALASAGRDLNNHREELARAVQAADTHIQSYNKESLFKSAKNVFLPKLKGARQEFQRTTAAASQVNTRAQAMVKAAEEILGKNV